MQLCADGYDVTNLVSADPALRRQGFKLEYFLRPPVQVRLSYLSRGLISFWELETMINNHCLSQKWLLSKVLLPTNGLQS